MEDRIVQHPYRYKLEPIDAEIGIYDLKPFQGQVTAVGSMYNKANVLPDDVCGLLGLKDTKMAEIKDAFTAVASGRFYGKSSQISSSNKAGYGGTVESGIAQYSVLDSNDFNNVEPNEDGKYDKIIVPKGASRVKISVHGACARATFGSGGVSLQFNGISVETVISASSTTETSTTGIYYFDVEGTGEEYFQTYLSGKQSSESDSRGYAYSNFLIMEVVK